jgi:hypothetical protein
MDDDRDALLAELLDLARRWSMATHGVPPRKLTLRLHDGSKLPLAVPSVPVLLPRTNGPRPDDDSPPWHSDDFRQVRWPLVGEFNFTYKQAAVIRELWRAAESGRKQATEAELLRAAESDGSRVRDLFRHHPAWGTLVVRVEGGYSLCGPVSTQGDGDQGDDVHRGEPWHNKDFTVVRWSGFPEFRFGAKQALVVSALWDARFDEDESDPDRDQAALLMIAESDCGRLRDMFARSPAWGTLIVKGVKSGTYRLADPEAEPRSS